jgi:plasmid stabilization system protein ParE
MAFNVEISPRAFRDLDELATDLKERSQSYAVARKWFLAVLGAIDSLAEIPERRPVVTEAQDEIERVRLLLHGKRNRQYRIYYCVRKRSTSSGTVSVFHVRHWARRGPSEDELREFIDELQDGQENGGKQ